MFMILGDGSWILFVVTLWRKPIGTLRIPMWCWIGPSWTMYGWIEFHQKYLCWCGAFFETNYRQKTTCYDRVLLMVLLRLVLLAVKLPKRHCIYSWIATFPMVFGQLFDFGWVFLQLLQVTFYIISISLLKWQACLGVLTHFYRSFGLLLFGFYGRRETIGSSKMWLLLPSCF